MYIPFSHIQPNCLQMNDQFIWRNNHNLIVNIYTNSYQQSQ